jgi:hypothetical protein
MVTGKHAGKPLDNAPHFHDQIGGCCFRHCVPPDTSIDPKGFLGKPSL